MPTDFQQKVYAITEKIPKGKVTTYKDIACKMKTKAYRAIGSALKENPYSPRVPCHRVVKTTGMVGGFSGAIKGPKIRKKISLLKKEGIEIKDNKIDLDKFGFNFNQK
tara:strand:+ start:564 stop:887 length:324 start_codon:yes stop_codon:yes gene_type:complete